MFQSFLQACKDAQQDPDFCIVARVEAFIAGYGLDEALRRAEAYMNAGWSYKSKITNSLAVIENFKQYKSFVYL